MWYHSWGAGQLRDQVDETRAAFARLIGAQPDEIAITKNVSEGLNLFAASLPWEAGDNVVVCPGLEHPNNIFLWYNLERIHGIEVRALVPEGGQMPTQAMADAMDERTRVVTFPTVSFAPGFITDVRALVEAAKRVGALTLGRRGAVDRCPSHRRALLGRRRPRGRDAEVSALSLWLRLPLRPR